MGVWFRELLILAVVVGICYALYRLSKSGKRREHQNKPHVATDSNNLNPGLYRLHRVFYLAIWIFGCFFALVTWDGDSIREKLLGLLGALTLFGLFGLAHWYAAKGSRLGLSYGRTISRVIAFFWLFGFPIGTYLGYQVFRLTGADTWTATDKPPDRSAKRGWDWISKFKSAVSAQAASGRSKVCPYCAETIKSAAVICRFCNRKV